MPRKKKNTPEFNKSEFIRKHPDKTAGEIEALAKTAGHTVTAKLVYVVRASDKARAKKKAAGTTRGKPGPKPKQTHAGGGGGITSFSRQDKELLSLIKQVGVDRANVLVALAEAFFAL